MDDRDRVLDFWFEGLEEGTVVTTDSDLHKWWFARTDEMNKKIADGFKADLKHAAFGDYDSWRDPKGRLALVIICDQFSRCAGKGTARAYDNDLKALEQALYCVKKGEDKELSFIERIFLYLPLMHSETMEIQEISLKCYRDLVTEAEEAEDINTEYFKYVLGLAQNCYTIINEFKRFPQRNKLLKRKATSTEINFVQNPDNLIET